MTYFNFYQSVIYQQENVHVQNSILMKISINIFPNSNVPEMLFYIKNLNFNSYSKYKFKVNWHRHETKRHPMNEITRKQNCFKSKSVVLMSCIFFSVFPRLLLPSGVRIWFCRNNVIPGYTLYTESCLMLIVVLSKRIIIL